jgi:hypothetical protein
MVWYLIKHRDNFTFHLTWEEPSKISRDLRFSRGCRLTLKMEAARSFETLVSYRNTRSRHNP